MALMTTEITANEACRPLRADAARNRELILETAALVFAEQGLDAGYDEIARRAGIGVGTVYRRFPVRSELVQALFVARIQEMAAVAEEAETWPDAWEGLTWFLEKALERQVADRGLKEVLVRGISIDEHRSIGRDRIGPALDRLVARAKAEGSLRPEVESTDIGMHLTMLSSMSVPGHPDLWRRYLALLFDGLRASPGRSPLPMDAPADESMYELMCNMSGRRI